MLDPTSRVAVIIASAGRPTLLAQAICSCLSQTQVSVRGVVSVPDDESLPDERAVLQGWEIVSGRRGAAAQRNAGLDHLAGAVDFVFFFDDDAVLRTDYIAHALAFFKAHSEVVGLTGRVLADGKLTREISVEEADATLAESWGKRHTGNWRLTRELYGANFAARVSAAPTLRFDDRLPLYSWLEDHDFARRLMPYGPLAYVEDCQMVHRAAASGGRANHRRLGYSQVMNAVYLWRKGSFPAWLAGQQIMRPAGKNFLFSIAGSATSWRRQRLRGNFQAIVDIAMGRIAPERAASIASSPGGS